jgi:hypothetical protein
MQTLAAYLIFLLVVVAVGLGTIVAAIATLVISEGIAWVKDRPGFRRWKSTVIEALIPGRARLEQQFHNLHRAIQAQLVQASHWRAQ